MLVYVRAYLRKRFGRVESVVAHTRNWPGFRQVQLRLFK